MIHKFFPVHVLVKDFDMPLEWNAAIEQAVQTYYFAQLLADPGESRKNMSEIPMELFSEANMSVTPELRELKKIFIDGFWELYQSYGKQRCEEFGENMLTYEDIERMAAKDLGRLSFMKTGDRKRIHNHTSSEAFGVFYLTDVDNKVDGGEIVLYDPAFHHLIDFYETSYEKIPTKKNRLIIGPAHVWHEVTTYAGKAERMAVVVNLEHNDK